MNIELIKRDFAAFADPATPVVVTNDSANWTQSRELRIAKFTSTKAEYPDIEFQGKSYSYREFLASSAMADLHGLAEMIASSLPHAPGYVGGSFVEPQVTDDDTQVTTT